MALNIHPRPGQILLCGFQELRLKEPEIVKRRPVIVLSPRLRRPNLCTVLPCSTTPPAPIWPYHYKLQLPSPLPHPHFNYQEMWVKCDLVYTLSYDRLSAFRTPGPGGRKYIDVYVSGVQLEDIRQCFLHGQGMADYMKS
jgi:mRNA interferase MazF